MKKGAEINAKDDIWRDDGYFNLGKTPWTSWRAQYGMSPPREPGERVNPWTGAHKPNEPGGVKAECILTQYTVLLDV